MPGRVGRSGCSASNVRATRNGRSAALLLDARDHDAPVNTRWKTRNRTTGTTMVISVPAWTSAGSRGSGCR